MFRCSQGRTIHRLGISTHWKVFNKLSSELELHIPRISPGREMLIYVFHFKKKKKNDTFSFGGFSLTQARVGGRWVGAQVWSGCYRNLSPFFSPQHCGWAAAELFSPGMGTVGLGGQICQGHWRFINLIPKYFSFTLYLQKMFYRNKPHELHCQL